MEQQERNRLLKQIMWDYNIPVDDVEALLSGKKAKLVIIVLKHFLKRCLNHIPGTLFCRFLLLKKINRLLSDDIIRGLEVPHLRRNMDSLKKDYRKLYQIQDKFLKWWTNFDFPFYLTGGTALGRFYLNHRCSEDLDFFVNSDHQFLSYIEKIKKEIRKVPQIES